MSRKTDFDVFNGRDDLPNCVKWSDGQDPPAKGVLTLVSGWVDVENPFPDLEPGEIVERGLTVEWVSDVSQGTRLLDVTVHD